MSQERERERFLESERWRDRCRGFTISSFSESLLRANDSFFVASAAAADIIGGAGGSIIAAAAMMVGSFLLPFIVSVRLAISLIGMMGLISFSGFEVFTFGLGGLALGIMGVM